MIARDILSDLQELMEDFPAITLLGPRQVGKTTLAKSLAKSFNKDFHYLDLEDENDFFALSNNARDFLQNLENETVIIDEIQIHPPLFSVLRSIIDSNRKPGRFILLGSANPALVKGASESLAGRVVYKEITQISLRESLAHGINIETHWFRGGFPEALLFPKDKTWSNWVASFIQSYIYRDLNLFFGINLNAQTVQRIWSMLAHLNSELENNEKLGRSLGLTGTTVKKYIEYMEGAYLIRKLAPWHANIGKRLVKSPKIYLRTPGILHHLLNIDDYKALQTHPGLGASWEGYVIEQVTTAIGNKHQVYFYRTQNGAEIDLVIVNGVKPVAAIEIKYSNSPKLSRGFYESVEDLEIAYTYVITPSSKEITLETGVKVCSLSLFLDKYVTKFN